MNQSWLRKLLVVWWFEELLYGLNIFFSKYLPEQEYVLLTCT